MYRVFLVDDRPDVVEGMISLVPWESLRCTPTGWAANGRDAYEKFEEEQPDIVITDIKMPVMDGLELIELCKKQKQQIRFIVLSGYDDFAFAQKAIRLGVDEYILKPAGVEEIGETLGRIVNSLDEARAKDSHVLSMKQKLDQSLPLLRDEYFRFLVTSQGELHREEIADRFGFLNMRTSGEHMILAVVEPSQTIPSGRTVIPALAGELLSENYETECFCYGPDELVLLLHDRNHETISERHLRLSLEELLGRLGEKGISAAIGLSDPMEDVTGIRTAFIQARQAVSYKMYMGSRQILFYKDVRDYPVQERVEYRNIEDALVHAVRINDVKAVSELITGFFEHNRNVVPHQMKSAVREITTIVCHYAAGADDRFEGRTLEEWQQTFKELQTAEELKAWMIRLFYDISGKLQENHKGQQRQYAEQVKYMIESHYAGNITLAAVSELIGLTPAYLSAIFKEETGQTFTGYLVDVRMKKARELLKTGNYKIYEVAEKVGYTDIRYFGETFKKKTGRTPKEFIAGES